LQNERDYGRQSYLYRTEIAIAMKVW